MDRRRRCPRDRAGLASQRQRRLDEQDVRAYIVAQAEAYKAKGGTYARFAEMSGIPLRTLEHWRSRKKLAAPLQARGRPPERGTKDQRRKLWNTMKRLGPKPGEPTLRREHPDMPVGELRRLRKRFIAWVRRKRRRTLFRLAWTSPGRVWAMDFGQPPSFLEPGYRSFLLVRDVASGLLITACPVKAEESDAVEEILSFLFAYYGPPLVLKSDNGSAIISWQTQSLLRRWKVLPLLSPAYTPRYNGSAENGIGMLKALAGHRAARKGRALAWSAEDLVWAKDVYNSVIARKDGTTAAERHAVATPLTEGERLSFITSCERQIVKARSSLEISFGKNLNRREKAKVNRLAIRNALIENGYLFVKRRTVTPASN
jgi:transposase InsO family protein